MVLWTEWQQRRWREVKENTEEEPSAGLGGSRVKDIEL